MNEAELRRRAQVRAIAFCSGTLGEADHVTELTGLLVAFVHETLVGDISDGPFIHYLPADPPAWERRFAIVECGRTFNLLTRAGRFQASRDMAFVNCPQCRTSVSLKQL